MREKNLMKISAILIVLVIVVSCIAPGIAVDSSANNTSSSNQTEEFNTTRTMIPSLSPFYAKHLPADNTTMHVHPQKLFRHEIYMPDEARASFSVRNNTKVRSNNDTITSGLQLVQYEYALSVYNTNDASDTVLGNLVYMLRGDNIIDVDKKKYADWNDSYVKWVFPSNLSDFILAEDEWLHVSAKTSFFETKYVPLSISRRMNRTIFDADGYQLAEFNITYDDLNFDYSGGNVIAKEYSLVNASFLPDTFFTDAPLLPGHPFSRKDENYIEFNLDKSQLQANNTYNFSVIVRVDLKGDNPSAILYKPKFTTWIGHDSISAPGQTGRNVTILSEMLPEHVHFVSASTNVTNTWTLLRLNLLVATLDKISEPIGSNNSIKAGIFRYYLLYTTSNSVVNQTYIAWPRWKLKIENTPDTSGAAVNVSNVTLESPIEFRRFKPNTTYANPPTYFWDLVPLGLSSIPEEGKLEINTYPNYTMQQTLGFDASREISPDTFDSPSNITIIINYTARETLRGFTVYIHFMSDKWHGKNLIKNLTVIDYSSQYLDYIKDKEIEWDVPNPIVGTTYTSTLKLRIEPIDNKIVKYLPHVSVREYVGADSPIIQNNRVIVRDFGNFTIYSNATINQSYMKYVRGVTFESILEEIQITTNLSINANPSTITAGTPTNVTFTVTSNSIPISDALITLSGAANGSATTNASGQAVISVNPATTGTITATASKAGYLNCSTTITAVVATIFDTGPGGYPAIMGTHNGTITPNQTINISQLYTYPCPGTGGHTEFVRIWGNDVDVNATWKGYVGDWHNITFNKTVVLLANKTYNYTIRTGSYPQIIHESPFNATGGTITCDKFIDANGKVYYDWIPAIRLWKEE